MNDLPTILQGLWTTIYVSLISLAIGVIVGELLFLGKKSRFQPLYWLSTIIMEAFEGVPVIVQLFFVFYTLPLISLHLVFSKMSTAVIVLSVNGAVYIARHSWEEMRVLRKPLELDDSMKLLTLSAVKGFGEIIKYSSLLSIIAVTELNRTINILTNSTANASYIFISIGVYLVLGLGIHAAYKMLRLSFFGEPLKVQSQSDN